MEQSEQQRLKELLIMARDALIPYMQLLGHRCIDPHNHVFEPLYNEAARVVMAIDKESKI
jgi:hypothetical protein